MDLALGANQFFKGFDDVFLEGPDFEEIWARVEGRRIF